MIDTSELDRRIGALFADGVRVLGLPKSVGDIYGLLFTSQQPLSLDDLVSRLGISKGSASQGLRMLRILGAVREAGTNGRRTCYQAEDNLRRLVGGFIREQIRPHIDSGQSKLAQLDSVAGKLGDPETRAFYQERLAKLGNWFRRGKLLLPLLQRVLGE
jgi:DNA-binding transcriptional regulator GbsR (MarR family)